MNNNYIQSPILYMGSKRKLISKGLNYLFPEKINNFYDVFTGSGIVSMNVGAKKYHINDINPILHKYYNLFKDKEAVYIINQINANISKYKLPLEQTNRTTFKNTDKIKEYKTAYNNLRKEYNKNKKVIDLYTLMFFSFSQQVRFNKSGEFNMPFGNNCFSENSKKNIITGCDFFKKNNLNITSYDCFDILNRDFKKDDFVYLDPPYLNTLATYNENNGWTCEQDKKLRQQLLKLHKSGVKFGMSNVFYNKDFENRELIDWCISNKLNVYTVNGFKYSACGTKNKKTMEVYICNYNIPKNDSSFTKVDLTEYAISDDLVA